MSLVTEEQGCQAASAYQRAKRDRYCHEAIVKVGSGAVLSHIAVKG